MTTTGLLSSEKEGVIIGASEADVAVATALL
jgi:hypothetical protein